LSPAEKEELRQRAEKNLVREAALSRDAGSGPGFGANPAKWTALWQRRVILFVVSLLCALIIAPKFTPSIGNYDVGDVARLNIKAPEDLLVEDAPSTSKKREKAMSESPALYDFDENASAEISSRVKNAFGLMRQTLAAVNEQAGQTLKERLNDKDVGNEGGILEETVSAYLEESRSERLDAFSAALAVEISENDFGILERRGGSPDIERVIIDSAASAMEKGVVDIKELIIKEQGKGIIIRGIKSQEEKKLADISKVLSLSEARRKAVDELSLRMKGWTSKEKDAVTGLVSSLVKPNLTLNKNETEKRKMNAAQAISPVFFHIKDGEMILREGERVTYEHILKIQTLAGLNDNRLDFMINLVGRFLMVAGLLFAICHFFTLNVTKASVEISDFLFLGILLVFSLLIFRLSLPIAESLTGAFPYIKAESFRYVFTAAASVMLVRIVLNSEVAIGFSIVVSMMAAMIMKNDISR